MTVRTTRLPSGLTVVTDEMPHLQTASLGIWTGSGSRDELPEEHGIAHMLEHMAFKGTRRRNAREIAEEIEAVGGDLNAATSVESTGYFARVLKADVPLALDVLSDILTEPTFVAEELQREQNVIVQEIGAVNDTPDDLVFEYLQETAFPGQPVGRAILGTPQTVRSFDAPALRRYLARNYRAPDMVLVAAGAVDHDQLVADAGQRLASFSGSPAPAPEAARFGGGVRIEDRDLEQAHIALAIEGLPARHPDLHALQVFTGALGGGMSSRLFQQVREERGLCYTIHAFHMPYADTGLFALYAGTDAGDVTELMRVSVDAIADAAHTITEAEVARVKAQMKASLLMALESTEARTGQLARQMLIHGRPISLEEIVAKIDAVTVERARAAGQLLVSRGRLAVSALGPDRGFDKAVAIAEGLVRRAA